MLTSVYKLLKQSPRFHFHCCLVWVFFFFSPSCGQHKSCPPFFFLIHSDKLCFLFLFTFGHCEPPCKILVPRQGWNPRSCLGSTESLFLFIYFWAVFGLGSCSGLFFFWPVTGASGDYPLVAEHGLPIAVACPVAEPGLGGTRASVVSAPRLCCSKGCGIFPDQGIKSLSCASAGRFFTTEPPGKPGSKVVLSHRITMEVPTLFFLKISSIRLNRVPVTRSV